MPVESSVLGHAVVRTAGRRVENHLLDALWKRDRQGGGARAADAAPDHVCALDAEVVEQPLALARVVLPRDHFDPRARPARLALVECDACEVLRELVEKPEPLVD